MPSIHLNELNMIVYKFFMRKIIIYLSHYFVKFIFTSVIDLDLYQRKKIFFAFL